MIVYDMVMNVLQHNIAGLISGITFIVLFQSGEASMVEGNKHTHTHTRARMREYQHKSTRVNTNQHESTRIITSPTRVNTSPTRV